MREIKFRAYKKSEKRMLPWEELRISHLGDALTGTMYEGVMRYTGLKDKNGKEIYIDDIIKWKGHEVRNGKQAHPERVWRIVDDFYKLFQIENIIRDNGTLEIIGNLHENPELLEARENG